MQIAASKTYLTKNILDKYPKSEANLTKANLVSYSSEYLEGVFKSFCSALPVCRLTVFYIAVPNCWCHSFSAAGLMPAEGLEKPTVI